MPTLKFDNQPDRNRIASKLGVNPYSLNISQNADGSWSLVVADDVLPDAISDSEIAQFKVDSGGDVDV